MNASLQLFQLTEPLWTSWSLAQKSGTVCASWSLTQRKLWQEMFRQTFPCHNPHMQEKKMHSLVSWLPVCMAVLTTKWTAAIGCGPFIKDVCAHIHNTASIFFFALWHEDEAATSLGQPASMHPCWCLIFTALTIYLSNSIMHFLLLST